MFSRSLHAARENSWMINRLMDARRIQAHTVVVESSGKHDQEPGLAPSSTSAAQLGSRYFLSTSQGKYYSNFNPGLAQRDCELCVTVSGDISDPLVGIYRWVDNDIPIITLLQSLGGWIYKMTPKVPGRGFLMWGVRLLLQQRRGSRGGLLLQRWVVPSQSWGWVSRRCHRFF